MIPPLPPALAKGYRIATMSVQLAAVSHDSNALFDVHFDDPGGGHYVVLDLDGCVDDNMPDKPARLALDPAEMTALAEWCAATCKALDGEGK